MKKTLLVLLASGTVALAACDNLTRDQRFAVGGLAGAGAGLAAADALDSSGTGKAIGALAGAAIGSSVAANYDRSSRSPYYQSQASYYPYDTRPSCRYSDGTIRLCPVGY